MRRPLRLIGDEPELEEFEAVDPRAGTSVAIGFPLAALLALGVWLALGPSQPLPGSWPFLALLVVCAAYGLFPLVFSRRTYATFEVPTLILVGIVAGPAAGVLAGLAAGLGDVEAVWRRRSTYAGLAMLQGLTAGVVGAGWREGVISLAAAVVISSALCLAIGLAGFTVIALVRQAWSQGRLRQTVIVDSAELLLGAPLVFLLAGSFTTAPLATALAAVSGLALVAFGVSAHTRQRSRLEQARAEQLRDTLTGALNARGFDEVIVREHARVLRGERPAGVLVLDLDHFGRFNEEHGHLGGNEALRHVVSRIGGVLRSTDTVARWGGEEFCVLSPRAGALEDVEHLAERIRVAVADEPVLLERTQASITVSVGATLLTDWVNPEDAFARADEALYIAKRRRNSVHVLAPRMPLSGFERTSLGLHSTLAASES